MLNLETFDHVDGLVLGYGKKVKCQISGLMFVVPGPNFFVRLNMREMSNF